MKIEIIPYVGFDKIKLGQTLGQIELLLGKATKKNRETYSDDFRLGTMTFYSKEFVINGINLIGLNESTFIMKSKLIFPDLELDDDFKELNSKDYVSNSSGIFFWLDNGIVESISIFPDHQDDDETPIWPN
jgi:hypothetical protein